MRRAFKYSSLVAVIFLWQAVAGYIYPMHNPNSERIFPAPSNVIQITYDLAKTGELWVHVGASIRRVLTGFLMATALGIPLGLSMGVWPTWRRQFNVIVELLRPIPPFAWIPLGLLWFGVGEAQSVFVIFIASLFPILMNTVAGIDAVDPIFKRAALCLGANRHTLFIRVILRAALPNIFVGLRIGLGFGWMVLVAAEFIGAVSGLGYLVLDSRNMGIPNQAFMGMMIIGVIGYAIDSGAQKLEKTIMPWRE